MRFPYIESIPQVRDPELVPYDRRTGDELFRTVLRLYRTSRAMRQPFEGMWEENWRAWEGALTLADTNEVPTHYHNEIWKTTESIVARLTKQLPGWIVPPTEENDEELAAVMELYLTWAMRKAKPANALQEGVRSGEVAGTGIWKTPWNPDALRGHGNTEIWSCDLLRLYFDLSKTRLDQMSFVIHEFFLDTAYVKRRWGVDIAPTQVFSDLETDHGLVTTANRATAFGTAFLPLVEGTPGGTVITGRTRVLECWLRDFVLESTGIALPEPQREKAKHPEWLLVYAVVDGAGAEGQILPSKGAPDGSGVIRTPYEAPPFVVYRPISHTTQFYGVSPLHPLMDPQREYNEAMEQFREHRRRNTQPHLTIDPRYLVDMRKYANRTQPIPVPPGALAYLNPPPMGREVADSIVMASNEIEDLSGIHDVSRGQRVPQLTSGKAIGQLQEAGDIRSEARLPMLVEAYTDIGANVLANGAQQIGLAGMLRLAGSGQPDLSKIDVVAFASEVRDVLDFDVQPQVVNSEARQAGLETMATLLAQAQMLDPEAVLEIFAVPGRHKILARMEKKQQMAQAMQMGQAAVANRPEAPDPYADETIVGAQDIAQLPQELQAVIAIVRERVGEPEAQAAFRGIQRERAQALAERRAGGPA